MLKALAMILAVSVLHAQAPDTPTQEGMNAHRITETRLGTIDAVTGEVNLSIPLGPKLPGDLPIGFNYTYSSLNSIHTGFSTVSGFSSRGVGGSFAPVVWPLQPDGGGLGDPGGVITVQVEGMNYSFYKPRINSTTVMPTSAEISNWMNQRSVNLTSPPPLNGENGEINAELWLDWVYVTSDGKRFLIIPRWCYVGNTIPKNYIDQAVILDGDKAIWLDSRTVWGSSTYVTNRWGAKLSIVETMVISTPSTISEILIKNELDSSKWLRLSQTQWTSEIPITGTDLLAKGHASIRIENSLGLPTVSMTGVQAVKQRYQYTAEVPWGTADYSFNYIGYCPDEIKVESADGSVVTTNFEWVEDGLSGKYLSKISTSGGYSETYTYSLDGGAPLRTIGNWQGMNFSSHAFGGDGSWYGFYTDRITKYNIQNTMPSLGIASGIRVFWFQVYHNDSLVRQMSIDRVKPIYNTDSKIWTCRDNYTTVTDTDVLLKVQTHIQLTHQSYGGPDNGTWGVGYFNAESKMAMLCATSAILRADYMTENLAIRERPVLRKTILFDAWDTRSWLNPSGDFVADQALPPSPGRIRVYYPTLPTKIIQLGNSGGIDSFGYTRSDTYVDTPTTPPDTNAAGASLWFNEVSSTSAPLVRTNITTRHWNNQIMNLQVDSIEERISGSMLPTLRAGSPASNSQVVVSYAYDALGRVTSTSKTRGDAVSTNLTTYVGNTKAISDSTKTLTIGGQPVALSGAEGLIFGHDVSAYQWVLSEKDKITNGVTTYTRDALGRVLTVTDPRGIKISYQFDNWGRLWKEIRNATPSIPEISVEHTYDPSGRWKEDVMIGEGRRLVTRTEYDPSGRVVKEIRPDGRYQITTYTGRGLLRTQSPFIHTNESYYGSFSWSYDSNGRIIELRDAKGRLIKSQLEDPHWGTIDINGKSYSGIVSTTLDDRGNRRLSIRDFLGQISLSLDEKNQPSFYEYNKFGQLSKITQDAQVRIYNYNDNGWLTAVSEPERGLTQIGDYTIKGTPRLIQRKGRSGNGNLTAEVTIDSIHRISQIIYKTNAINTITRSIFYRDDLNVPSYIVESQPFGTIREDYQYDELARLTGKTVSDGQQMFVVSRTLDALGNMLTTTYPSGGNKGARSISHTCDSLSRPKQILWNNSVIATYTYDQPSGSGLVSSLAYGNGAAVSKVSEQGELTHLVYSINSGVVEDQLLEWSPSGLLTKRGNDTFGYDELGRLSSTTINGINGEVINQGFSYDRFGNRTGTTSTITQGTVSSGELLTWSAVNPAQDTGINNQLFAQVQTATGVLNTAATNDDYGRLTSVWTSPGIPSTQVNWVYDDADRVVQENGTKFLLDMQGLRHKRIKADGSIDYNIYGFNRDLLSVFRYTPATQVMLASGALVSNISKTTSKTSNMLIGGQGPIEFAGAYIVQPIGNISIYVGNSVTFMGGTDFGTTASWNFGDGATAGGWSSVHQFNTVGSYTVRLTVSGGGYRSSFATMVVTVASLSLPSISSFSATPTTLLLGGASNLSWYTSGATSASISGIGSVPVSGTLNITPTSTTTYTLQATNAAGSVYASLQITVNRPPTLSWLLDKIYSARDELVMEDRATEGIIFVMSDPVGTPTIITNYAGVIVGKTKAMPFGERISQSGIQSSERFASHENADTGYIYMQARTYLPIYGRMAQPDPLNSQWIGNNQTYNLYNYVGNNPITKADPSGMWWIFDLLNFSWGQEDPSTDSGYLDSINALGKSSTKPTEGAWVKFPNENGGWDYYSIADSDVSKIQLGETKVFYSNVDLGVVRWRDVPAVDEGGLSSSASGGVDGVESMAAGMGALIGLDGVTRGVYVDQTVGLPKTPEGSAARSEAMATARENLSPGSRMVSEYWKPNTRLGPGQVGNPSSTNKFFNNLGRIGRYGGGVLVGIEAVRSGNRIITATPDARPRVVTQEVAGWSGAFVGATVYSSVGAVLGMGIGGPAGALAGYYIGGFIGGYIGGTLARDASDAAWEW